MADRATPVVDRRQPLLKNESATKSGFGEMAGSTAAECAAVCCCCPCALLSLLVLVVVKFPAGLCWKAIQRKKKASLLNKVKSDDTVLPMDQQALPSAPTGDWPNLSQVTEASPLEDEMWANSYTGFWTNPSERE